MKKYTESNWGQKSTTLRRPVIASKMFKMRLKHKKELALKNVGNKCFRQKNSKYKSLEVEMSFVC